MDYSELTLEQLFAEADAIGNKYTNGEIEIMPQSIGYYGGDYGIPEIKEFAERFEDAAGNCSLSDNDQAALVAVLAVHAWGLKSGLQDDFWTSVGDAIGDGVETSMENETASDPMLLALSALESLEDPMQCWSLITWLIQ